MTVAEEPRLYVPPGWSAFKDDNTQRYYYVNDATKESTWTLPEDVIKTAQKLDHNHQQTTNASQLPPGWMAYFDQATRRHYYVGPDGKSTWTAPNHSLDLSPVKTNSEQTTTQSTASLHSIETPRSSGPSQEHLTSNNQCTQQTVDRRSTNTALYTNSIPPVRPRSRKPVSRTTPVSNTIVPKDTAMSRMGHHTSFHNDGAAVNIEPHSSTRVSNHVSTRPQMPRGPPVPSVSSEPCWKLPTKSEELKLLPLGDNQAAVHKVDEELKAMLAVGVPKKSPKQDILDINGNRVGRRFSEQIELATKGKVAFYKATANVQNQSVAESGRKSHRRRSVTTADTMEQISSISNVHGMKQPSKVVRPEFVVRDHLEIGGFASLSVWRGSQGAQSNRLTDLRQGLVGGNDYLVFDKTWRCVMRATFQTGGFLFRGGIDILSGDGNVKIACLNKATMFGHVHDVFYVSVPSLSRDGSDTVFATIKKTGSHHWNVYAGKGSESADCLYQLSAWERYAQLRQRDPASYRTGELSFSQVIMEYKRGEPLHIAAGMDAIVGLCCFLIADNSCKWDLTPDKKTCEQIMARANLTV